MLQGLQQPGTLGRPTAPPPAAIAMDLDLFPPLSAGALLAALLQLPPVLLAAQRPRPFPPESQLPQSQPAHSQSCRAGGGPDAMGSLPHQPVRHGHQCPLAAVQSAAQ